MNSWQLAIFTASRYNILPLTSICNLHCLFCSHRQNPPGVKTIRLPPLQLDQVDTLLDFLDGSRKIVIGESATRLIEGEPLTHPKFLEIITRVRRRFPRTTLVITTNGTLLALPLARALAGLEPLELNLSLNSASQAGRLKLMGDRQPDTALEAPRVLNQFKLTYHGSLVALPWITGWQDFRETVLYLSRHGARTIRIFLPGYTRLAPPELRFPAGLRQQIETELESLRRETSVPLFLEPPCLKDLTPVIEGVIPGSAAERAGLSRGDIILAVDGRQPRSRVEAFRLVNRPGKRFLHVARPVRGKPGAGTIDFPGGEILSGPGGPWHLDRKVPLAVRPVEIPVEKEEPGLTFAWDFDPDLLGTVAQACRRYGAQRPLILTSVLAFAVIKQAVASLPLTLEVQATPSRFFGGSIACAGLLTLEDFQAARQTWEELNGPADLIILPAVSFDHRGFDLLGNHYLNMAGTAGIPVELARDY